MFKKKATKPPVLQAEKPMQKRKPTKNVINSDVRKQSAKGAKRGRKTIKSIKDMPSCPAARIATSSAYQGDLTIEPSKFSPIMIVMDVSVSESNKLVDVVYIPNVVADPRVAAFRQNLKKLEYRIRDSYTADKKIIDEYHKSITQGKDHDVTNEAKFAEDLILKGLKIGASDVHIFITDYAARVEYRVDGKIGHEEALDAVQASKACSVMYGTFPSSSESDDVQLNPRTLQNARFERRIGNATVACRFASAPMAPNGLKVVLRILKQETGGGEPIPFTDFGYEPGQVAMIELACRKPIGLTIVAGVTGSGKSTTLANMCKQAYVWNKGEKSIYTVEDPPEYVIPVAVQIPVIRTADSKGGDASVNPFALALRGCMRLDPDVIMVGEIRDSDTAQITKGAVTSGHQVLTSIHAPSWIEIINRLQYYGVGLQDMASQTFFSALIYQRLLAVLCQHCSEPMHKVLSGNGSFKLTGNAAHIADRLAMVADKNDFEKVRLHNPKGCEHCKGKGTAGRTVAAEVAMPDRKMIELIGKGDMFGAYDHWRKQYKESNGKGVVGMKAVEHGIRKVLRGQVCPLEVEAAFQNFRLTAAEEDHVITCDEIEGLVEDILG